MRFILLAAIAFSCMGFSAYADTTRDFFRLSNIKDALVDGDCQRYGGYKYRGDVAKLAVETSNNGTKIGNYRNVVRYDGGIYVLWSYRSGLITRTMEWCIFK
ncbi:hypothetical protein [Yoonia vestfoldensis]|uniref:hypothetical protein n=1 Tax=Yoonia vestfoldensis TaxID=245188 RepID=UPI0003244FD1|nr:hypothetical protein [Yoonia vestfoldensis]